MGGLAMPYNDEHFFEQLIEVLAKDPDAPNHNWFFDVLPLHAYDRSIRLYELPMGYLGYPSWGSNGGYYPVPFYFGR